MSDDPSTTRDPQVIARAIQRAIESAIPGIVEAVLLEIGDAAPQHQPGTSGPLRRRADADALASLIEVAHRDGRAGVLDALSREPDLVAIGLALHPVLGQKVRRWRDTERTRATLADEILKRAHRYEVFREPSE